MDDRTVDSLILGETLPERPAVPEAHALLRFLADDVSPPSVSAPPENPDDPLTGLLEAQSLASGSDSRSTTGRREMRNWMEQDFHLEPSPLAAGTAATYIPALARLAHHLAEEFLASRDRLKGLNPSRRNAVAAHLHRLAGLGLPVQAQPADWLTSWLQGPLSPAQEKALRIYAEEVALCALGRTLVLKAWSDRGIRTWTPKDLTDLHWALNQATRALVPPHRECWQVTAQNIYSWFQPSGSLQREIWAELSTWQIGSESPRFLTDLLRPCQKLQPAWPELKGYDPRLLASIWDHLGYLTDPSSPSTTASVQGGLHVLPRKRFFFSPTLRDGLLIRAFETSRNRGPDVEWVALEADPFLYFLAELAELWKGPAAPHLWMPGWGLEVHAREQLQMAWQPAKPSTRDRITDIESFEVAWVCEERVMRAQGKSAETMRLRALLDEYPYFKDLRAAGTSLGHLQACVALSKLRPGGVLIWAREEALSSQDGEAALRFFLDRARLLMEWDFTQVEHQLQARGILVPRHLYVWVREPAAELRAQHRSTRIQISGNLRSHVEVSSFYQDALTAHAHDGLARGQWKITRIVSPTPQAEWVDHWPDPTEMKQVQRVLKLKEKSTPLGQLGGVRAMNAQNFFKDEGGLPPQADCALWIMISKHTDEARRLHVEALDVKLERLKEIPLESETGFLVHLPDALWVEPLAYLLQERCMTEWLDFHCERKGARWVLKEQTIKYLPIPHELLEALKNSGEFLLAPEWEKLASELAFQPKAVLEAVKKLNDGESSRAIWMSLFVRTSNAIRQFRKSQRRLLSMVNPQGQIRWGELIRILPQSEKVSFTVHGDVRLAGSIPPHIPIDRMEQVRLPAPGVLFTTEHGLNVHVAVRHSSLAEMLWEQIKDLKHPTWHELTQHVALPRSLEIAHATAQDILRSHGDQTQRISDLEVLRKACFQGAF